MRAPPTIARGPVARAPRRPPGRAGSHKPWTDRRGPDTSSNTILYGGQRRDPITGSYQLGARTYAPERDTYIQPDSALQPGTAADPAIGTDPLTANTYAYVNGNPLNFTDPTGHAEFGTGESTETDGGAIGGGDGFSGQGGGTTGSTGGGAGGEGQAGNSESDDSSGDNSQTSYQQQEAAKDEQYQRSSPDDHNTNASEADEAASIRAAKGDRADPQIASGDDTSKSHAQDGSNNAENKASNPSAPEDMKPNESHPESGEATQANEPRQAAANEAADSGDLAGVDRGDGRDAYGHFTGEARYGASAQAQGLDDYATATGRNVIGDQVRATLPDGSIRYYDGLSLDSDGTYQGVEVKGGSAGLTSSQRAFDGEIDGGAPATAMLRGSPISITSTYLVRVP